MLRSTVGPKLGDPFKLTCRAEHDPADLVGPRQEVQQRRACERVVGPSLRGIELNWDDLRFVLTLHRYRSYAGAARALGVSHSTVQRRVRAYESAVGTRLFERQRNGRVRTRAEVDDLLERLAGVADKLVALNDEIGASVSSVSGLVRVTGAAFLVNRMLLPTLPDLLRCHPALDLEFVVDTVRLGITHHREADIAIRLFRPDTEAEAITRKIADVACGVYARRDLDLSSRSLPWVAFGRRASSLPHAHWIAEQQLLDRAPIRVTADDAEVLVQSVRAGLGKTVLPSAIAERFDELVRLDGYEVPSRELWLVMHPSWREVPRLATVVGWIVSTLGPHFDPERARRAREVRLLR